MCRGQSNIRALLSLCMAAVCIASQQSAAVSDSSCSASIQPSEATRALTQSALLACSTVLQPTGALEWLVDVQHVRLRDVLDGRLVDAVQLPALRGLTLAELVQLCWPSPTLFVRAFLSYEDQESHSRLCASASAAAADALHSPLLALARVLLSVNYLPALPLAMAASILPHATVALVLLYFAPAVMVVAPLWSLAIIFFALIDLYHTPLRVVAAFRSSTNRIITFFLRRLFVRVAMALVVALVDSAASAVFACMHKIRICTFWLRRPHLLASDAASLQSLASPFLLLEPTSTLFAMLVTSGSTEGDCMIDKSSYSFAYFTQNISTRAAQLHSVLTLQPMATSDLR